MSAPIQRKEKHRIARSMRRASAHPWSSPTRGMDVGDFGFEVCAILDARAASVRKGVA